MAPGTCTVPVSLKTEYQRAMNDPDWQIVSEQEFVAHLLKFTGQSQVYSFQALGTGYWVYRGGGAGWFWSLGLDDWFTYQADATYELNTAGGSVVLTGGADTSATLEVTLAPVDFPELMVYLLTTVATKKAGLISQGGQFGRMNAGGVRKELMRMAEAWRGTVAIL